MTPLELSAGSWADEKYRTVVFQIKLACIEGFGEEG